MCREGGGEVVWGKGRGGAEWRRAWWLVDLKLTVVAACGTVYPAVKSHLPTSPQHEPLRRFKQDASVEVRTTMAGYMSTLFYDPHGQTTRNAPFGTRVHKYVFANLHDHLSSWKVDLDVVGVNNSFVTQARRIIGRGCCCLRLPESLQGAARHASRRCRFLIDSSTLRSRMRMVGTLSTGRRTQTVKVGTYEDALREIDPEAKMPGWAHQPYLKYISTERRDFELGLKVNASRPTVSRGWHFLGGRQRSVPAAGSQGSPGGAGCRCKTAGKASRWARHSVHCCAALDPCRRPLSPSFRLWCRCGSL